MRTRGAVVARSMFIPHPPPNGTARRRQWLEVLQFVLHMYGWDRAVMFFQAQIVVQAIRRRTALNPGIAGRELRSTPRRAPAIMSLKAPTRKATSARSVAARMATAMASGSAAGARRNSETARTPITAGAMPFITALTHASFLTRSRIGRTPSMMTKDGRNAAPPATAVPAGPAALYPTYAAIMRTGPGVSWPSARPSMNSRDVSQPYCPTTWSWMNAIMARPPPIVNAPTLRKYMPMSHKLFGSGFPPGATETDVDIRNHQAAASTARKSTDETTATSAPGLAG